MPQVHRVKLIQFVAMTTPTSTFVHPTLGETCPSFKFTAAQTSQSKGRPDEKEVTHFTVGWFQLSTATDEIRLH